MINKRLIKLVPNSYKNVFISVLLQHLSLIINIYIMYTLALNIYKIYLNELSVEKLLYVVLFVLLLVLVKVGLSFISSKFSYKVAKNVKLILREKIYSKLLKIDGYYETKISTAEVIKLSTEGVDSLEIYFSNYLPQFFYSLSAPVILFICFSFFSIKVAVTMLILVPLIPMSIVFIQKIAKRVLKKYWSMYAGLSDNYLDNLKGMNTLLINDYDQARQVRLDNEAENFRKVTMKVLLMQLNSIIVMDIFAYGGAALGILLSVLGFINGEISFVGAFFIILLAFEFFLPLRVLGSFFHIAMNGINASKRIFELLDFKENNSGGLSSTFDSLTIENLNFAYDDKNLVLDGISLVVNKGELVSIVGESGSGKSTLAKILTKKYTNYNGNIKFSSTELFEISKENLLENVSLIESKCKLFNDTVRNNLVLNNKNISDEKLWSILDKLELSSTLRKRQGLDTLVLEGATNFSGGQIQRLAIARSLLHKKLVYIFDEVTSSVDVESEKIILKLINDLSKENLVIMITHKLKNIENSNRIYVLENSKLIESGTFSELLENRDLFSRLYEKENNLLGEY